MEYIARARTCGHRAQAHARRRRSRCPSRSRAASSPTAREGLDYAHTKTDAAGKPLGIVHRDVSPQNILVTYEGAVKVVDFGIAKAADAGHRDASGMLKGKYAYMSPEQAGPVLDARSDIFALGMVLFELLTRSRLFQFSDPLEALRVVASDDPIPQAYNRSPEVPVSLSLIIARALARDPAQRYSTGRQFQYALEEWLRSQPEVPGAAELSAYMHERFGSRIQERAKMLEAARNGELSSSGIRRAVRSSTGESTPGASQVEEETTLEQAARKRAWLPIAAAVGGLLLLGGVGVFIALRPGESVEPVAPPVAAPPVAPAPPILTIETDPPGALIKVDGQEAGHSPLTLDTLSVGEHTVAVLLEGRTPAERQVKLGSPGERAMVLLALAASSSTPNPPTSTEPGSSTSAQGRRRRRPWASSPWTPRRGLASSCASSGWGTPRSLTCSCPRGATSSSSSTRRRTSPPSSRWKSALGRPPRRSCGCEPPGGAGPRLPHSSRRASAGSIRSARRVGR